MKKYLLLGLSLALAGCATQKALPQYSEAQKQAQRESIGFWQPAPAKPDSASHTKPPVGLRLPPVAAPDSLPFIAVARQPTFLAKLFGRTPKTTIYPGLVPVKAGKKSTVNIYNAPATITTLGKKATAAVGDGAAVVVAAKKAGPVVLADSGATVQVATVKKGQAAAGDGITQQQPPDEGFPNLVDKLFGGGIAMLLGAGAVAIFLTSGGPAWLLGLVRRRKSDNQA